MDRRLKADRKRMRQAILAQLSQRQMTFLELADELDHVAPTNQLKAELGRMVASDLVCSLKDGKSSHDLYETWERAVERVKAKGAGRRHIVATRARRGERMA